MNLGEDKGIQRIILYEDDDSKVIAERFCGNYGLNEKKQEKLERLVKIKMEEHLEKMGNRKYND